MKSIGIFIISYIFGYCITTTIRHKFEPKTNLPEEYKLITKNTPIRGYMNKDSVLVIEFVHENKSSNIKFKWEGLDSNIPEDGIRQLQLTTNGDTVYLNSVDE